MSLATASLAVCQAPGLTAQSRRQQQQQRRGRAAALVVRAADTPNLSGGLTTTNSSLLGPKPNLGGSLGSGPSLGPKLSTGRPQISLDDVQLKSGVEVDYSKLRDLLKEGKWREAEDETRELLIQAAGKGAVKRGWVYFSEVKFIPVDDMRTLDELWKAASGGKFGYSVQREIWLQNRRQWPKFFKAIDWVVGENNVYRKWPAEFNYSVDAPKGHLPLTNALRGTRLFEAIMEHEAFNKSAPTLGGSSGSSSSNGAGQPGWLNK